MTTTQSIEEGNKQPMEYFIGVLMGEIIWLKLLCRYTEMEVINTMASENEKSEYDRLDNLLFERHKKDHFENKGLPNNEFENYRKYAHELIRKHCPSELVFEDWTVCKLTDIISLYKGIENYLWNTDECCYSFSVDDIKVKDFDYGQYLTIKFNLDYQTTQP